MSSMQAEFEALTDEAAEWDTTADALSTAAQAAAGLTIEASTFSFISQLIDVQTSYLAAQQRVVDVCSAGERETRKLADALRQVRQDFESTDADVVRAIGALWVPE